MKLTTATYEIQSMALHQNCKSVSTVGPNLSTRSLSVYIKEHNKWKTQWVRRMNFGIRPLHQIVGPIDNFGSYPSTGSLSVSLLFLWDRLAENAPNFLNYV